MRVCFKVIYRCSLSVVLQNVNYLAELIAWMFQCIIQKQFVFGIAECMCALSVSDLLS